MALFCIGYNDIPRLYNMPFFKITIVVFYTCTLITTALKY